MEFSIRAFLNLAHCTFAPRVADGNPWYLPVEYVIDGQFCLVDIAGDGIQDVKVVANPLAIRRCNSITIIHSINQVDKKNGRLRPIRI